LPVVQHPAHGGGFSVDAAVRIEGADRAGLERLLRYCARPPFALEHLQQRDAEHLVYRCPQAAPGRTQRGPPLWEAAAASPPAGNDPHWELAVQPLPQIEFDQRLTW
jgi:hypothetical protein